MLIPLRTQFINLCIFLFSKCHSNVVTEAFNFNDQYFQLILVFRIVILWHLFTWDGLIFSLFWIILILCSFRSIIDTKNSSSVRESAWKTLLLVLTCAKTFYPQRLRLLFNFHGINYKFHERFLNLEYSEVFEYPSMKNRVGQSILL